MSATSPTGPFDQLGLDAPFAEDSGETDRYEAMPAWNALGESPYADASTAEGSGYEGPESSSTGAEDLAWLDTEAESNTLQAFADDFALDGREVNECEHEHDHESLVDANASEEEYLDDEERDANESHQEYAPRESFEQELEAAIDGTSPLTAQQRTWIHALERTAVERLPDAARDRFLGQDWSDVEFPGNVPKGQHTTDEIRRHWALARSLFNAMASVVPERRVPSTVQFRDRPVVKVPGQPTQRLFAEACDAFVRMRDAAKAEGVDLFILSSWRSRTQQAAASARQPNPNAVARKAPAHMYGLAVDLRMGVPGLPIKEINTRVDRMAAAASGTEAKMGNLVRMYRSPVYKWLSLRARTFGWFPYRNEPWHWEYNPSGLKARFEGDASDEFNQASYGSEATGMEASWEQVDEMPNYSEGDTEEEGDTTSPLIRTFTAKALNVKVAVYVTRAARNARQVEMLVFAHGLDLCRPVFKNRPATFITERPFRLGDVVEASGRPIVLVVPFLDWEHLAANGMAFGQKWHRLAEPATFNQIAAEALGHARTLTGSPAAPTILRLILAGHSRAYGFFDALAHAHASPEMRMGALGRPTHIWALDTAYSAPIADWRAWLRSRDDLQATVIYRQGKYQNKGSTVMHELATGMRGREFMKLAISNRGRLTVMPVPASKIAHCAIPAAYLPRLLANLPVPTASNEDGSASLNEVFGAFEDETSLATAAEVDSESEAESQTESSPLPAPKQPIVIDDYPRYATAIPPSHLALIQPLITTIIETLKSGGTIRVTIVGHADFDAKGREFETQVSMERATVGRDTLLAMLVPQAAPAGFSRDKVLAALNLTLDAKGTTQPRQPRPASEDQRKQNRRVEFFWEATQPPPPSPPDDTKGQHIALANGVTFSGSTEHLKGERFMRFVVKNIGVASTVTITDITSGGVKISRWMPVDAKAEFEFAAPHPGFIDGWIFRVEPSPVAHLIFDAYSQAPTNAHEHEGGDAYGEDELPDEGLVANDELASEEWIGQHEDEGEGDPERRPRTLEPHWPSPGVAYTMPVAASKADPQEPEVTSELEATGDALVIIGKWTVRVKDWIWEYEFLPGGKLAWRDTRSNEKGVGRWSVSPKVVNISWTDSKTTESWIRPLTPEKQKGWFKSSYYTGYYEAEKVPTPNQSAPMDVDPSIANLPWGRYVDAFTEMKYDINYKIPADRSFAFSSILQAKYYDGVTVEFDIESDFSLASMSPDDARDVIAHAKLGRGDRIVPAVLNIATTPRLWLARADALRAQDEEANAFMGMAVKGTAFILSVPAMPAGLAPAATITSKNVSRRAVPGAEVPPAPIQGNQVHLGEGNTPGSLWASIQQTVEGVVYRVDMIILKGKGSGVLTARATHREMIRRAALAARSQNQSTFRMLGKQASPDFVRHANELAERIGVPGSGKAGSPLSPGYPDYEIILDVAKTLADQ